MKFAEMTQEVQVAKPTPIKVDNGYTPGRRKANQLFKMAVHNLEEAGRTGARKLDVDIGLVYSLGPKFPDYRLNSPESNELIVQLMHHLDQRIQKRSTLLEDYGTRREYSFYRFLESSTLTVPCYVCQQKRNSVCS